MSDTARTVCNQSVGELLQAGADVTSEATTKFLSEPEACASCKDALKEA